MRELTINNRLINDDSDAYVIAELGHNHQGDVGIAKEMILRASLSGADAIKLQRIDAKRLFTKTAYDMPYNSENAFADTYGKHRDFLTLSDDAFKEIRDFCEEVKMTFICTAFEEWSADFLNELGIHAFKVASFHAKDAALINHIKAFDKPMIVSTGHCLLSEVEDIHKSLEGSKFALLQCTSEYPVRNPGRINLGVISTFRGMFPDTVIGYSHHYHAPYPAAISGMIGARIIEVHFTLNRAQKGTDQSFSLEPDGIRWLVNQLRMNRTITGFTKDAYPEELGPIEKMSRSVYPARTIEAGAEITAEDICLKAPLGQGFKPGDEVEGRISINELSTGNVITPEDLK